MAIKKLGIDTNYATYDELKTHNVIAQGWEYLGDLCCLKEKNVFDEIGYKLIEETGDKKFSNFLRNMFLDIKSGDIILAYEGNCLKGIAEIPPRFQYELNTNIESYQNTLYPVNWVDWNDFSDTNDYNTQGGRGVPGIQNCGTPVASYIETNWNTFKEKQGLKIQPESCELHLEELEASYKSRCESSYKELKKHFSDKIMMMRTEEYKEILKLNHNIILTGAPGTGKTYLALKVAEALDATKENGRCKMVQFHPSYDYTDFVEGLRPVKGQDGRSIGFERKNGVFMSFCKKAFEYPDHNYVFIIDEINRGEISKIFGELFFSIDPGYRGPKGKVLTQYANLWKENDKFDDGYEFYIPENVYIIGTMNDIDRSVESMDFAFRRRFAFKEIDVNDNIGMLDALNDLQEKAKIRMTKLNEAVVDVAGLSKAFQIGGAYFLKLDNYKESENPFNELWNNHLEPLLKEYLRGRKDADTTIVNLKEAYDNENSVSI